MISQSYLHISPVSLPRWTINKHYTRMAMTRNSKSRKKYWSSHTTHKWFTTTKEQSHSGNGWQWIELSITNIIDVISQKHDIRKEPKTYLRGSKRKDALFWSKYLSIFLNKCGSTSFNEVTSYDHGGLFFDLRLTSFFKNSYIFYPDHTSRPLKPPNNQSVINYKRYFRTYLVNIK